MTLLLSTSDVARLLTPEALLPRLREAFRTTTMSSAVSPQRARTSLPSPAKGTAVVLFPGLIEGVPAYTVKVHAKHPGQDPAIRGVLLLHDLVDGALLAVMDSTLITAVRTGLAGALAADVLGRRDATRAAIIGAGAQGELLLRGLTLIRPIQSARVFDVDSGKAATFAARLGAELDIDASSAPSAEQAVADAEVVATATWARQPFLFAWMIRPGTHVSTLGPDEPGKVEVDAGLLRRALVVCDDRELASSVGAVAGAGLGPEVIAAELGEILAGLRPGRTNGDQITVYGGVGLPFQDLAAAWLVYESALREGIGLVVDFLA